MLERFEDEPASELDSGVAGGYGLTAVREVPPDVRRSQRHSVKRGDTPAAFEQGGDSDDYDHRHPETCTHDCSQSREQPEPVTAIERAVVISQ